MRTLGIDLGTRRIGLALSDESGKWVTPHEVLFVTDPLQAIDPIAKLVLSEDIRQIVIGLPLNMDETIGTAAKSTLRWSQQLAGKISTEIELIFVDERLSSFDAEQQLIDRKRAGEKLTRKRKKEQLDAVAAAGFLQAYLDGKLPALKIDK